MGSEYDEDGVRVVDSMERSDALRREKERQVRMSHREKQDDLRTRFAAGELTMAEYAKEAREAGVSAKEVAAALQERAAADKRIDKQKSAAEAAAEHAAQEGKDDSVKEQLAAALADKAKGLDLLKRGEVTDAAAAFARAASTAAVVAASPALIQDGARRDEARELQVSSLLNDALCRLKLEDWNDAEAACSAVLALGHTSVKALYRRGTARLRSGRAADAAVDLTAASKLKPSDKDIERLRKEAEAAVKQQQTPTSSAEEESSQQQQASTLLPDLTPSSSAGPPLLLGKGMVTLPEPGAAGRLPDPSLRTYCYLDVAIGGAPAGRLAVQLFDDLVPTTACNFRRFCIGTDGHEHPEKPFLSTPPLCYQGAPFHRVVKGFVVQGGDVVAGDGSGGVSAMDDGFPFADESFAVPHSRPGVLSMANTGPDTNGCQFFLTLAAAAECDKKHVAFGRLIKGLAVLRRIEALSVDDNERPLDPVVIIGSGELSAKDAGTDAEEDGVGAALDLGGETIVRAALAGDLALVRQLIERGVPVDAYGSADIQLGPTSSQQQGGLAADAAAPPASVECTALAVAAHRGHLDMLDGLLRSSADPSRVDSSGHVPLHLATLHGHTGCAARLLAGGADALAPDSSGKAAAHLACLHGRTEILRAVVQHTAAARDAEAGGLSPLHIASAAGHADCVEYLLSAGSPHLGTRAVGELTPLHLAAAQGALAVMASLLKHGAEVNLVGERSLKAPLHAACEHGRTLAVAALLDAKAEVSRTDLHGSTPLHWACKAASAGSVAALLGARALPNAPSKDGSSPLHMACEAASNECVSMLLDARADATRANSSGVQPLHAASAMGHAASLELLLAEDGVDVNATLRVVGKHDLSQMAETHTKTALYLAAENGHAAAAQLLLRCNADVLATAVIETNQATTHRSALWAARRGAHEAVAELLVAAGGVETAETVPSGTVV